MEILEEEDLKKEIDYCGNREGGVRREFKRWFYQGSRGEITVGKFSFSFFGLISVGQLVFGTVGRGREEWEKVGLGWDFGMVRISFFLGLR